MPLACADRKPAAQSPDTPATATAAGAAAAPAAARLTISRTGWLKSDQPFEWRGITAFRLAEQMAHGREAEAIAYLDWAQRQQLTVVRVLAMAKHLFELKPDEGLKALPRLLSLAADRDLVVEVV